eukprot:464346-Karenia_brevis.AAC.1
MINLNNQGRLGSTNGIVSVLDTYGFGFYQGCLINWFHRDFSLLDQWIAPTQRWHGTALVKLLSLRFVWDCPSKANSHPCTARGGVEFNGRTCVVWLKVPIQ